MPVPRAHRLRTEAVESGATSTATNQASMAADGTGFARILATTDVWVVAGPQPVAEKPPTGEAGDGLRAQAGQPLDLALSAGDRIAVVDA